AQVEGGQAARVVLAVPAPRRGRLPLGRVVVATRYPLGLFRAWSLVEMEAVAIVYPKPSAKAPPLPPAPRSGGRQTVAEAGSDDFRGLRNYQDGDSPRHVHWKAWARQEQLLTKQFQRQQAPELWLDWDSLTGPAETKLSHLCRWLLDAAAAGERYGLRLPGETLPPGQGAAHRHRCLAALALCGEAP
ncbi:MAG TPA: DUF58 domain-containing protein, partial [Gammaproteobacteria bacterium]|nr:DUF58 domain-containing protein [Gammaproteobacteria bacterium]